VDNARTVIALELLSACQAIDLAGSANKLSEPTKAAYRLIRSVAPMVKEDRIMYQDIQAVLALVADGAVLRAAEESLGREAD